MNSTASLTSHRYIVAKGNLVGVAHQGSLDSEEVAGHGGPGV